MSTKAVSQSLRRRSSRTLAATLAAVVLLVLAAGMLWGAVSALTAGSWPSPFTAGSDAAADLTWNAPAIWAVSAILLAAGLALLLAAILPGKHTAMNIAGPGETELTETVITRRGVARLAVSTAEQIDGVDSCTATVSGGTVNLRAATTLHDPGNLEAELKESLERRFEDIGLDPIPRIAVRIH